jgi:predicted glycosyltransferase
VRVWVDITDSSHVLFFAPVVRRLEDQGHIVTLTARRFASAELMMRRLGLVAVLTGQHRGGGAGARAVGLVNRTAQLLASASSGRFDVAVGSHASDFVLTAWALGVPQLTLLDDERLRRTNVVNVRLVDRVAVPDLVSTGALRALGATPDKLFRFPGFKEEYYLHDFQPDADILAELGIDRRTVVGVVRPPRDERDVDFDARWQAQRALPAPGSTGGDGATSAPARELEAFVRELAKRRNLTLVLLPRSDEQRRRFAGLGLANLVVPEGPVDGVSLIAAADFVLGAGGVMDREAVALGTPAYTLSRRAPSAVDAALLAGGRLKRAQKAADIALRKKDPRMAAVERRDPQVFVDEALALGRRRAGPARLGRIGRTT